MSQYLELKDKFGNSLYFSNGGDVWMGPSPWIPDGRERLAAVKDMELREDDVIIAGFMKSGNHWVQQICRMLIQGSTDYQPNTLNYEVLEYIPPDLITPPDHPRAFFTHLRFHHLPKQVMEKKVKIIHLIRNPKDTFVSMYCHNNQLKGQLKYDGTWEQFFSVMLDMGLWHGDWFDHLQDWEQEIAANPEVPVLVVAYEDLRRDTVGHILKLNEFLGLGRSVQLCKEIADSCSLKAMQEKEEGLLRNLDVFQNGSPGIYRKGVIGDWKNWFTVAQNEVFDEVYRKRMVGSKRTFTFE